MGVEGRLSGDEIKRLTEALLIAFPTWDKLREMLWVELQENLNEHVGEGALEDVVPDLLDWAESRGRLTELVSGALEAAPSDRAAALRAFAEGRPAPAVPPPAPPGLDFASLIVDGTEPRPSEPTPANLLNAIYGYVPFYETGRAALIAELDAWYVDNDPVRARLIHGEGGMGKTRLLLEVVRRRRAAGWTAGFLRSGDASVDRFEPLADSIAPALVVIDYAESRADLKKLLAIAADRRKTRRSPLRIILLARNDGDWWSQITAGHEATGNLLTEVPPLELAPLARGREERAQVFGEAARAFAAVLGKSAPGSPPIALDDELFERTLYLHIAALAAVERIDFTAGTLMDKILDHEQRFWTRLGAPAQGPLGEAVFIERLRASVSALTLLGGARGRVESKATIERAIGVLDEMVFLGARRLYPGRRAERRYLGKLEPDLLGEAMVRRMLLGQEDEAGIWLNRVFGGAGEEALQTGFEVLGRVSVHEPAAREWMGEVLEADVVGRAVAAFEAGKAVGKRTAHATLGLVLAGALEQRGTAEVAERIEAAGIPDHTVSLREVACWVMGARLAALPDEGEPAVLEERARLLNNLGNWQSQLGQREAALASAGEAMGTYRTLADVRPDAFLPDLATSLNNLGAIQSELGQREAAIASTNEAVVICRTLAEARPDAFLPDLATSLNNLGMMQSALGLHEAALASASEVLAIRRKLAGARPDAFLPDLAMSLNNLGKMQSELGQREAALASVNEATTTYRTLAGARPDAFLPDLATSLNNLGAMQHALGQREAALTSTNEALTIRRKLTEARPDAFLPDLAASLNNLGMMQSELGQQEAALASDNEAVAIRRMLAEARPDAFLPDLAASLDNLGNRQSALGQREAALASTNEALTIRRKLAEARPDAFLPDLATSLNNLGNRQSALGQREAALASVEEAVAIRRTLAEARPDAFLPDLAMSLNNLGNRQRAMGQREAALASTDEAVATYRTLAEARPDAFLPYLAGSLTNLGNMQSALGQREAALASADEAVAIYRTLAEARPDAFLPDLALSLNNLGMIQSELGQREAALASVEEAVAIRRTLAEARPDAFLPDLAMSLSNLGMILSALGRREAALASAGEAVATYRALVEARPDTFLPDLAMSLNNLGMMQSELGQREAALASADEAVATYRALAEARPDTFLPDLASSLNNLGNWQGELEQREAALASAEAALAILWQFFLALPPAFAQNTAILLRNVLQRLQALGREPGGELLERIAAFNAKMSG